MLNIIQLQKSLEGAPDSYLLNEMKRPSGSVPQYLVLTEMQRRKAIRDGSAPQQPPHGPSVADRVSREFQDINETSPDYTAMPQEEMDLPTEPPADYTRPLQGYAEGGMVGTSKFSPGGGYTGNVPQPTGGTTKTGGRTQRISRNGLDQPMGGSIPSAAGLAQQQPAWQQLPPPPSAGPSLPQQASQIAADRINSNFSNAQPAWQQLPPPPSGGTGKTASAGRTPVSGWRQSYMPQPAWQQLPPPPSGGTGKTASAGQTPVSGWRPSYTPQQQPVGPRDGIYRANYAAGGLVQNPNPLSMAARFPAVNTNIKPQGGSSKGNVFGHMMKQMVDGSLNKHGLAPQSGLNPNRVAQAQQAGQAMSAAPAPQPSVAPQVNRPQMMAPLAAINGAAAGANLQAKMAPMGMASGGIVRLAEGGVAIGEHRTPQTLEEHLAARRGRFNPKYRDGAGIQSTPGPLSIAGAGLAAMQRYPVDLYMNMLGHPFAASMRRSREDAAAEKAQLPANWRDAEAMAAAPPPDLHDYAKPVGAITDAAPPPVGGPPYGPYDEVSPEDLNNVLRQRPGEGPPPPAAPPGPVGAVGPNPPPPPPPSLEAFWKQINSGNNAASAQSPSIEAFMAQMRSGEDPYARFADKLANYEEQAQKDRSYDRWMGVAQMGLGMMNNKDPNFLSAVGQGAMAGMPAMAAAEKDYRDRTFKMMGVDLAIEDARAKLAQGDRAAAIELYKTALQSEYQNNRLAQGDRAAAIDLYRTALQSEYQNKRLGIESDKLNQMPDPWRIAKAYSEASPEMQDALRQILAKGNSGLDGTKQAIELIKLNMDALTKNLNSTMPGTEKYNQLQAQMRQNSALINMLLGIGGSPMGISGSPIQ